MDYILNPDHAISVLWLSLAFVVLILGILTARLIVNITKIIKQGSTVIEKLNDLIDVFIEYIQKPLGFIVKFQKKFRWLLNFLVRKKKKE